MDNSLKIAYDLVPPEDVLKANELEQKAYPPDEAGSLATFQYRQTNAGGLFLGVYHVTNTHRELIGYVCGTLSPAERLTHQSMSEHVPSSSTICIHSVCISDKYRGNKLGLNLLKEYVSRLETARNQGECYERILLITHDHLRSFYEQAGFECVGKSDIVHGSHPWYEMRRNLKLPPVSDSASHSNFSTEPQVVPVGLWEALQRSSSDRARPSPRVFSGFPDGILELTQPHPTKEGSLVNKYDIACPRPGCGSVILKSGIGEWVERESIQLEPDNLPPQIVLPPLPPPPDTCQWWLITPSPMHFENIGFSRPVQSSPTRGPKLKLLACAECDLGPLGWCEEGGTEFWLTCTRVSYLS